MNLFKNGEFISHSGQQLNWKIECDALTSEDWDCLARIIHERIKFGSLYGVPRGGILLAKSLEKYITPGHPLRLVVDDVYTTGNSIKEVMKPGDFGFVVFARNKIKYDPNYPVRAIFTMDIL